MKVKWYFSVLIVFLTLLGICQEQNSVPNQEIVLQFTDDEVTNEEAQNTIAIIKEQLQTLGINDIQVGEQEDGRLKITYYSDANVASIKKILSKGKRIELGYTSYNQDEKDGNLPSNKNSNYNFDVYEIQSTDLTLGFDGKYVLEIKQEYERFSNPNVYSFEGEINVTERCKIVKVAYRVNRNIAIAIDNTLNTIPEVRAGPGANGILS